MMGKKLIISILFLLLFSTQIVIAGLLDDLPIVNETLSLGEGTETLTGGETLTINLNNVVTKLKDSQHYSSHIWGESSAEIDKEVSKEVWENEIEIGTESGVLGSIVAYFLVTKKKEPFCQFQDVEDMKIATPLPGFTIDFDKYADDITQMFMNLEDIQEGQYSTEEEEKRSMFLVAYGGPVVNSHARQYSMDKNLPLYFEERDGKWVIVDKHANKVYDEGEYGMVMAIPRVSSISLSDLNTKVESDDKILLYRTIIAGITREGTQAGGLWYADMLNKSDFLLELITQYVCGQTDSAEIADALAEQGVDYLINNVDTSEFGDSITAVKKYSEVMIASSLNEDAKLDELDIKGYAALVKYDETTGFRLIRIYPV